MNLVVSPPRVDIKKSGGILIKDRKLLIVKSHDREFFLAPGGKVKDGENPKATLIRELQEECAIEVKEEHLEEFGTFFASSAGNESKMLRMDVFIVNEWQGDPTPNSEIERLLWITSDIPSDIRLGSIFEHEVVPRLKERGLID